MYKPLAIFIGLRYLRAKRRNGFISFISAFTILGLFLGTAVLILVLSVMNGFSREISTRILGAVPHVVMEGRLPLNQADMRTYSDEVSRNYEIVAATAPYVRLEAMLSAHGLNQAVLVNGIDPQAEKPLSIFDDFIVEGGFDNLQPGEFSIILGSILAGKLGVDLGDELIMVIPQLTNSPLGTLPRLRRFTVGGIYALGSELDASIALVHISDAAVMKDLGSAEAAEGIKLKLENVFAAPALRRVLARQYSTYFVASDWSSSYGNLFAAIQLEKRLVGLLLFLIIAVASFNLVSTLVMLVNDKQQDIAILRTMGAKSGTILGIFLANGALSGFIGIGGGVAAGILLSQNVGTIVEFVETQFAVDFLSAETYFIDYLPSHLVWSDVLLVCGASFLLSLAASIYPAWRAANLRPVESLRYE